MGFQQEGRSGVFWALRAWLPHLSLQGLDCLCAVRGALAEPRWARRGQVPAGALEPSRGQPASPPLVLAPDLLQGPWV